MLKSRNTMISNPMQSCLRFWGMKTAGLFSVLAVAMMFTLSSCTYFWVEPYGSIALDIESIRKDDQAVFLPDNAPSISQGYSPASEDQLATLHAHGHPGIDIIGNRGTPVLAPASGVVIKSYFEPMAGHQIKMDLGRDEKGRFVQAIFGHLENRLVRKGDTVTRGQQIGTLGSTGLLAAGLPHLHYAIYAGVEQKNLELINPHWLWADGVGLVTCFDSSRTWPETPLKTTYPVPCRGIDRQ